MRNPVMAAKKRSSPASENMYPPGRRIFSKVSASILVFGRREGPYIWDVASEKRLIELSLQWWRLQPGTQESED